MKKYTVYWILVSTIMGACPISPVVYDKFGRKIGGGEREGELCYEKQSDTLSKVFPNRTTAIAFYKDGIDAIKNPPSPNINDYPIKAMTEIWIDSTNKK